MRYKAVIFDLDGVITNSDQYHYLAWKQIAGKLGVPFDQSINNRLRGVSRMDSLNILLENYPHSISEPEKLAYTEEKNALYRQLLCENMTRDDLRSEIKDTMDQLRNNGLRLAVGSSSKNTKLILKQLGLGDYFDAVSDGTNITKSKPDPEVFLKAGIYLQVSPEACLVVEDAKAGIQAALAAHMDCAAIGDGTKYGLANYNLNAFSDLIRIVL